MNHEPVIIDCNYESRLIGFCSVVNKKSKYLIYNKIHNNIKPAIRRILNYLESVVLIKCFCRSGIHPVEVLINEIEEFGPLSKISTDAVSKPFSCHRCMGMRVAKEFCDLGIINIDILFQFAVDLYLNLKMCKSCKDYRFTGCKKCQLRQSIELLLENQNAFSEYIVVPETFIIDDDLYSIGKKIDLISNYPKITDFNYYRG